MSDEVTVERAVNGWHVVLPKTRGLIWLRDHGEALDLRDKLTTELRLHAGIEPAGGKQAGLVTGGGA